MNHNFYDCDEVDESLESDGISDAEEGFMKGYLDFEQNIWGIYTYRVNYINGPQKCGQYGNFN